LPVSNSGRLDVSQILKPLNKIVHMCVGVFHI
jgi:hypothetical protein